MRKYIFIGLSVLCVGCATSVKEVVPAMTNCSLYLKDLLGSATVKGVYNKGLINRRVEESLSCFRLNGYKGK